MLVRIQWFLQPRNEKGGAEMLSSLMGSRLWRGLALLLSLLLGAGLSIHGWLPGASSDGSSPGQGLPLQSDLDSFSTAPSSKIYDRRGQLLFEMPPPYTGRHSPVPLGEIPEALRQAIIATEDASFYENPGVDMWAIVRALWINLRGGKVLSGGSTITQQLARNLLLSPDERYERTLSRKLREMVLAWRLARNHTKDEILELYLNEIYFGNMSYGVEAAAQAYFAKPVRDLDLAECAMLAGLPQAPSLYNPLENMKAAKARQAIVLDLMVRHGHIAADQARMAKQEQLHFASTPFPIRAPHFVMYVRNLLEQELGLARLEQGGLQIYTTLDLQLNETARDLVRYRLKRLAECRDRQADCPPGGHNVRNAAVVALDPLTGEILAMVGSPDYFSVRIDGAVNGSTALRQPGSALKPITYAAAFEQGTLTAATMMLDARTSFLTKEGTPYVPLNYDLRFRGPVRLREALASSYNLIAVKVLDTIGVEAMTGLARRLGITTFDDVERLGLAVTLGGGEVRLLELTATYAALANNGHLVRPVAVRRVEDADGQLLWSPGPGLGEQVLDERIAYLITDILSDDTARTPSFGELSVLGLERPAAVKTGTTTDFRDNWTVGYTPELSVGVWVGNADNEPMHEVLGISGAAPVWHDLMDAGLKGAPAREFQRPGGLAEVEVCSLSGLRPGADCPHRVRELFLEGTQPTETCTAHQRVTLDQTTGQRPAADRPPALVRERAYTVLPPDAQDRTHEQGISQPPPMKEQAKVLGQSLTLAPAGLEPALVMSSPDAGAIYRLDRGLPREAQRIVVSAQSSTGLTLAKLTLLVDGQPLAHFGAQPYKALWQLEPGAHAFSAQGEDVHGRPMTSGEVRIQVQQ
jgi:1A family penicillin-binding protein